ncbi:hypothetical protein PG988_015451 [Apiospora saccharicola]
MAPPEITSWEDLLWASEVSDRNTGRAFRTEFGAVLGDDDEAYFGQIDKPQANVSLPEVARALFRIPDEELLPRWREGRHDGDAALTVRRILVVMIVIVMFNIVRYHGCRVRRGFVTGLVLYWHACSLEEHLEGGGESVGGNGYPVNLIRDPDSRTRFIDELESAVGHLHALDWADNDIQPGNVLVTISKGPDVNSNEDKAQARAIEAVSIRPVLIDFESARKVGENLGTSRGRNGWIDCDRKDYRTSEVNHDIWALARMREWLNGYASRHY